MNASPWPRAAWRVLRIAAHIAHGLVLVAMRLPRLAGPERDRVVQRWSAKALAILGVSARSHGPAEPRGLLVANHVSWLDVLLLLATVPQARFVAKSEVAGWPLIGRLVAGAGTLFIARGDARALRLAVDEMAARLSEGGLVAVFPEGTTSDGHGVLAFRPGPLEAAVLAGVPVLPVALRYASAAASPAPEPVYAGSTSFARSLWRIAAARGLDAQLQWLPPLDVRGAARRTLAGSARSAIAAALHAMHASSRCAPPAFAAARMRRMGAGAAPAGATADE